MWEELSKWPHCTDVREGVALYQTVDALSYGVLYYSLINILKSKILGFLRKKGPPRYSGTLCSVLPRTANILDHLEMSWFGPIFVSSTGLAIDAHILVTQAEIIGLLFPLTNFSGADRWVSRKLRPQDPEKLRTLGVSKTQTPVKIINRWTMVHFRHDTKWPASNNTGFL